MALVARIFIVLFAFVLACLAAAVVMNFALLLPAWTDLFDQPVDQQILAVTIGLSAALFSFYAVLPAMMIIALAEGFRLRSVLFYMLAGAALALGLAYGWDLRLLRGGDDDLGGRGVEIMAAVGIVAGFVYWVIAGRSAGAWRKPPAAVSVSAPK
ncbi:MAG: hypothetical protein JO328_00230 [Hyphomicrobiales bacterium]|nr:hypothetical protein [Hyphomicrobiales bacterium]MBV8824740.1 hypothetical protein [Hyphomicrobiales bacterium]MBV9428998.1 hypothetical protein [Bradyrhizobiaceae bacterium]